MEDSGLALSADNTVEDAINGLEKEPRYNSNFYIISTAEGEFKGIISSAQLYNKYSLPGTKLGDLIKEQPAHVEETNSLRAAIEIMADENVDVLAVLSGNGKNIVGILSYANIISGYKLSMNDHEKGNPYISIKRNSLKLLLRGKKIKRFFTPGSQ
jgi:CBS domain-containing protein